MAQYDLRTIARQHFAHLADRKEREHAAEQRLKEMFFADLDTGWYVEVGANDPVRSSQTWHLEQRGWRGLLVEPIPELCARLRAARPASTVVEAACGSPAQRGTATFHVGMDSGQSTLAPGAANWGVPFERAITVTVRTLDDILDEARLPRLDLLCIDVEGVQVEVLQGLDLTRHRPRLLLLEDHLHDWAAHRLLTGRGYRLVKRTGLNNWYVPRATARRFRLTTAAERLRLWRKLWLGTPLRHCRHRLQKRV